MANNNECKVPVVKFDLNQEIEVLQNGFVFGNDKSKYFSLEIENIKILIEKCLKENVGKKLTLKVEILEY